MSETTTIIGGTAVSTSSIHAENMSIGGNINQYFHERSRFVDVNFGPSDESYLPPNFTDQLFQLVMEKKIVFVSGSDSFEKPDLIRHISKKLVQQDAYHDTKIVELLRGNGNESEKQEIRTSIFDVLAQESCEDKIVLLYDIHPEKIDYNFEKLLKYSREKNCVFIISASCGLEIWSRSGRLVSDYWFEIPDGRHYSETQFQDFFLQKLNEQLPVFLEEETADSRHFLLSDSISVEQALERFTSIDQVNLLVSYYSNFTAIPSDRKLNELIETLCQSYEQRVRTWFYQLSHKNKILAMCAALFDGLLIDQYFEALETITQSSFWDTSDPSLKAIDYFDLSFLDLFFRIQSHGADQYINSKTTTVKHALLKLGKQEYRRHFKVALQTFHQLTTTTYARAKINWELFGTSTKRSLVRKTFTDAVRDIGMLEFGLIEGNLLELAASSSSYLQNIGAKSMAQWRLSGNERLFFNTLENWQADDAIALRIKELFERNTVDSETDRVDAIDLIKVTAVLALGHASYYDRPNHLHEEIIHKMVHFAKDASPKVNESIQKALPKFIHHHSLQLQHILFDELMPIYSLREPITEGLILAMEDYPEKVSSALENWFNACQSDASRENRRHKPTQRDNILIIILDILNRTDLQNHPFFSLQKLYEVFLIPLLREEKRSEVQNVVIALLAKVQACNFKMAERFSDKTIGMLDKSKRLLLVMYWGEIYKNQRIVHSPDSFEEEGVTYPLWTKLGKRPQVPVENILYQWMEGDSTLRRFATLVFLEMERCCDFYERKELMQIQIREQQEMEQMQQMQNQPVLKPTVQLSPAEAGLELILRIRIFFYFLFSSNTNKYLLKDTIILFLNVNRYSSENLVFVIKKWRSSTGIAARLGKWLNKFM